jgi:CRISPR-associated exonuclease Cas4
MQITGTHINYYFVCRRKLWFFANGIQMEHTSDLVYEGKLIHEESYPQRASKYEEVQIGGIKVDFYDAKNRVIHEVKKSGKMEDAHIWQLKYYLYIFEKAGIEGVSGILEYPKLRKKEEVFLSEIDKERIVEIEKDIERIIESDQCPQVLNSSICKKCSYYDICFISEDEF